MANSGRRPMRTCRITAVTSPAPSEHQRDRGRHGEAAHVAVDGAAVLRGHEDHRRLAARQHRAAWRAIRERLIVRTGRGVVDAALGIRLHPRDLGRGHRQVVGVEDRARSGVGQGVDRAVRPLLGDLPVFAGIGARRRARRSGRARRPTRRDRRWAGVEVVGVGGRAVWSKRSVGGAVEEGATALRPWRSARRGPDRAPATPAAATSDRCGWRKALLEVSREGGHATGDSRRRHASSPPPPAVRR